MNRPYSEATRERVARAIHNRHHGAHINSALADALWGDPDVRGHAYELADAALDALAAVLLPEGVETRTEAEFMYRLTYNDGQQRERTCDSLDVALAVAASPANWQEPGRPDEVFERRVTTVTGPWTQVDAVRLAEGDNKASDLGSVPVEETTQ